MSRIHVTTLLAGCAAVMAAGHGHAGGFSRGTADTDILFEEGNFNMRSGVAIVMPKRGFATVTPKGSTTPIKSTDGDYSQQYTIPSAAVKFNLTDDLRCAGTYTQPFGADSVYGPQATLLGAMADGTGTASEEFITNEFGATCAYKFDLQKGRLWLLGGGFVQDFSYTQKIVFAPLLPPGFEPLAGTNATLKFEEGYTPGFRIGAAYEIPEIALRAQVIYRSAVSHTAEGTFRTAVDNLDPDGPGPMPVFGTGKTIGYGTLPQSVELRMQSGIAPGWLAFGSVKWTDWSVLDKLDYSVLGGPLVGNQELEYYFRDGWTVTAGVGHSFSESVSGVLGFTWDRGVSTTEDTLSDTYTLAAGVALKDKLGGEVRFGGAISYLTAASVSGESTQRLGEYDPGATFGYSVDGDWTYALSAGYKLQW